MKEQHIEELLKKLPDVKDHRDPQLIYQNVSLRLKNRKRLYFVVPSFATATILLLSIWFLPSIMGENYYSTEKSSEDKASYHTEEEKEITINKENDELLTTNAEQEESNSVQADQKDDYLYTAVYETEVKEKRILTYPIPDINREHVIYVTVVEPEEQGKTLFEQYLETMDQLDEEKWGLSDFYPLNGELTFDEENKILQVNLLSDHPYGNGSASEMMFFQVINETANLFGATKTLLYTDGEPGAFFGNSGELEEIPVERERNHAYYLYHPEGKEMYKPFLVASEQTYDDIYSALEAMKQSPEKSLLEPSIPEEFIIQKVSYEDPNVLVIHLDESAQLTTSDDMIHSIEAILLTAKEFDYDKVRIENANIDQVGRFHFNENWNVPIAPNKISLEQ